VHGEDTNDHTQTFDVVVTRIFDAPVEEVWKAWSDPEYVKRWWGPAGFTSPSAEMDFRVGGASLVCMRAPEEYGGQDMYHTWTYTRIDPQERIEFVSNFADEDGGRTEITVTEYGYTTERACDLSKAGMEQCLDKMAAIFAGA
jgi:uncharacterized protein YndB with AHSA1/START domain